MWKPILVFAFACLIGAPYFPAWIIGFIAAGVAVILAIVIWIKDRE